MPALAKGCIAEFLGVFALVFFGAGSIILTTVAPDSGANLLTVAIGSLTLAGDTGAVFGFEALLTFALMFAVLWCVVDERAHPLGGYAVGLTMMMCILIAGPLTGASMNPARTFGPALYGHWNMRLIY